MKESFDNCWNTIGIWSQDHSCPKLPEVIHCHNCDVYHQATAYVYDAPLTDEYRDECTHVLREHKKVEKAKANSVLTFEVFDEWLAIPACYVKEITSYRTVQRIPHNKNPIVQGLINISGEIEISFSLGTLLGLRDWKKGKGSFRHVIIADYDNKHYVFPVSQLGEVLRYHDDDLQAVPSTSDEKAGSFMQGIVKWKRQQVGALDAELLFSAISRSM